MIYYCCTADFGSHDVTCKTGQLERAERIIRLQTGRGMSARAATITVDAAMYGIGCVEGQVRERIEREKQTHGQR